MNDAGNTTTVQFVKIAELVERRADPGAFQPGMEERGEKVRQTVATFQERRWVALPPRQGALPAPISPDDLYIKLERADSTYAALTAFYERRQENGTSVDIRLNRDTGLPGFVYGDLGFFGEVDDVPSAVNATYAFLSDDPATAAMLCGALDELVLAPVGFTNWDDGTRQLILRQLNDSQQRGRVYGGFATFTFDAEHRLVMITSSLFPVSSSGLDLAGYAIEPEMLKDFLNYVLPKRTGLHGVELHPDHASYLEKERYIFPFRGVDMVANDENWLHRKEIPQPDRSRYRPVVRVPILDETGKEWLVILDMADLANQGAWPDAVVDFYPFSFGWPADYVVFRTPQDADAAHQAITTGDELAFDTLVINRGLQQPVNLGSGVGVQLTGTRFVDPAVNPLLWNDPERYLGATIYYHLCDSQTLFAYLLSVAVIAAPISANVNPLDQVAVHLEDTFGSAEYKMSGRFIRFPKGQEVTDIHGLIESQVMEPGFDADVIMHEMTHAVAHFYFEHLGEFNNDTPRRLTWQAFHEGIAFFIPCTFSGHQFGEFAYKLIASDRDLSEPPQPFSIEIFTDTYGMVYGLGMWWAKVFWQIRQEIGDFSILLLKAMATLATLQAQTLDTQPQTVNIDRVREVVTSIAVVICDEGRSEAERQTMQDLFVNLGIPV